MPEPSKSFDLLRLFRKGERLPPVPDSPIAPVTNYSSSAERIKATGSFGLDDIDLLVETFNKFGVVRGTPWDDFRLAHCVLPDWLQLGLDPLSDEYAAQQHKLWSVLRVIDRDYSPTIDEKEDLLTGVDAVRRPGYFIRRDPDCVENAAHHVIASGMILKHCGLKPGDSALEYGAGFAQTALSLARLGIVVDTVDISKVFCDYVTEQAAFFQVPLTSFEGAFGFNPRGDHKYDLIFFYESFHHCADFRQVVHALKRHLAPNGCVLLAGEPIPRTLNSHLPYPWGLRLDAESIVQIRRFGWFELGFNEDFLVSLFCGAGFCARRFECEPSIYGEGYTFKHRGSSLKPASEWLSYEIEAGWNNPEPDGRWTKAESRLYVDMTDSFTELVLEATNHHPFEQPVEISYGSTKLVAKFKPGERKEVVIVTGVKASEIIIRTCAYTPATDYVAKAPDSRALGIFVHAIHYR